MESQPDIFLVLCWPPSRPVSGQRRMDNQIPGGGCWQRIRTKGQTRRQWYVEVRVVILDCSAWRVFTMFAHSISHNLLGSLKKTTTATAPQSRLTKGLMSRTIAVYVRYNSLYIPLPSSSKQQREMTKFCVVWRTRNPTVNFFHVYFGFIDVSQIHFRNSLLVVRA